MHEAHTNMRTSRVARETARVVSALSPTSRNSILRRSTRTWVNEGSIQQLKLEQEDVESASESGLSSPQSSPQSSSPNNRKRKREDTTTLAKTLTFSSAETTTARRSPRKAPKLEQPTDDNEVTPKRKPRRQPAKHIKGPNGDVNVEPPPNWEEVYNVTAEMRKRWPAPVDTMGCESLAEDHRSPRDRRLQTLIALMLSSQTKDTVTAVAMKNLQDNLPGGFCLESLSTVEPDRLNELIAKVGFHNNKTKYIKSTAVILRDQFGGDIPDSIDGLCSLPGVGPKMAYLCMSAAWGRDEGIGVDVHVHRITNLWGWHKTSSPEQTRAELESWLPRDKWHDINHLLVGFGQTYCPPVGRRCEECDLSKMKLCPSATASSPVKRKVRKKVEIELDGGDVVKAEEIKVEQDDFGSKIEAELVNGEELEMQAMVGAERQPQ